MHKLLFSNFIVALFFAYRNIVHPTHLPDHAFQFHQRKCSRDPLDRQIRLVADFIHMQRFGAQNIQLTRLGLIGWQNLARGLVLADAGKVQRLHNIINGQ